MHRLNRLLIDNIKSINNKHILEHCFKKNIYVNLRFYNILCPKENA